MGNEDSSSKQSVHAKDNHDQFGYEEVLKLAETSLRMTYSHYESLVRASNGIIACASILALAYVGIADIAINKCPISLTCPFICSAIFLFISLLFSAFGQFRFRISLLPTPSELRDQIYVKRDDTLTKEDITINMLDNCCKDLDKRNAKTSTFVIISFCFLLLSLFALLFWGCDLLVNLDLLISE